MIEQTNQSLDWNWQPTIGAYLDWSLMKVQRQHNGAKTVLQQMVLQQLDVQNHPSHHTPHTFHKDSSERKEIINLKCKDIKLLEDNDREELDDLRLGNIVFYTTPKAQAMKRRINKMDFI